MYGRRIANRCGYRLLVTETEDVNECRDTKEDLNLVFDDIGCDSLSIKYLSSIKLFPKMIMFVGRHKDLVSLKKMC